MKKLFGQSKKDLSDAPDTNGPEASKAKKAASKGGSFTVGDLLMSLAMLALFVGTYFGFALLQGDKLMAFVVALCIVVAAGVLLFFAIKAKKQTNNRKLWLITECGCVAVLVVGLLFGTYYTRHYIYIYSNKDQLLSAFNSDVSTMADLYKLYETQEKQDIGTIAECIKSLPVYTNLYADKETRERLSSWKTKDHLENGGSYDQTQLQAASVSYTKLLNKELVDTSYRIKRNAIHKRMENVGNTLNSSSGFADYMSQCQKIEQLFKDAASGLNELSGSSIKYRLEYKDGMLRSVPMPRDYSEVIKTDNLRLANVLSGNAGSTASGWVLSVVIVLLILCPYFAAPRSRRVLALSKKGYSVVSEGVKLY